jgi:hypothetical protein
MRNIVLVICATLIFAVSAFGQVNKANPLGGEIKEIFHSADSKVITEVKLLTETDPNLSVPVTNVSDIRMTVLSVTVKLLSGEMNTTTVNRQATPLPDEDDQPVTKAFQLEISNAMIINIASPFRLPKHWEAYSYKITCNIAGEAQPRSTAILHTQKPTGAITIQNFNLKVDKPIWIRDANGVRSTELTVPLTSTSASLVAELILRQGGAESRTPKPFILPKGEQTFVKLNVQNFGEQPIEIRVRPTELEAVQLNLTGVNCSNAPNDPFCTWGTTFVQPFQINQADSDLKDLKITSLAQPKTIRIRTTSSAKTGSVKAKLNGSPVNITGTNNTFQLILDPATLGGLKEGDNTLEFEGESLDGVKLSETTFKFIKNTQPQLVGYPTFSLDGNSLKLTYELSGDVETSEPRLTYRETGGIAGTFLNPNCTKQQPSGNTKCSPQLTVSIGDSFQKAPQIPVKLEIFAQERGKASVPVGGSIGFDLLNQGAVKKILDEIRTNWKSNKNEAAAIQRIATEVLKVEVTNEKVKETFDQYVKATDGSDKRKQFLQFLTGVGNFALKGFGIPIQIPTDLVN